MLRANGATVQMPYEEVTQDYSQTTYTSGRMALTSVRRVYDGYQTWFGEEYCQPDYDRVIEEGVLRGDIPAPRFEEHRDEYLRAFWVGPRRELVDPQKEGSAFIDLNEANLMTKREILMSQGKDRDDHYEQLAAENKREEELGIKQQPPAPAAPSNEPPEPGNDNGENEES